MNKNKIDIKVEVKGFDHIHVKNCDIIDKDYYPDKSYKLIVHSFGRQQQFIYFSEQEFDQFIKALNTVKNEQKS